MEDLRDTPSDTNQQTPDTNQQATDTNQLATSDTTGNKQATLDNNNQTGSKQATSDINQQTTDTNQQATDTNQMATLDTTEQSTQDGSTQTTPDGNKQTGTEQATLDINNQTGSKQATSDTSQQTTLDINQQATPDGNKQTGNKQTGTNQTVSKQPTSDTNQQATPDGNQQTGNKKTGNKQAGNKKTGNKKTGNKQATSNTKKQTGNKQATLDNNNQTGSKQATSYINQQTTDTNQQATDTNQMATLDTTEQSTQDGSTQTTPDGNKQTGTEQATLDINNQTGSKQATSDTSQQTTLDMNQQATPDGNKQTGNKQTGTNQTVSKQPTLDTNQQATPDGNQQTGNKKTGNKQAGNKKTGNKKTGNKQATSNTKKQTGNKQATLDNNNQTGSKQATSDINQQTTDTNQQATDTNQMATLDTTEQSTQDGSKQTTPDGNKQTGNKQATSNTKKQTGNKQATLDNNNQTGSKQATSDINQQATSDSNQQILSNVNDIIPADTMSKDVKAIIDRLNQLELVTASLERNKNDQTILQLQQKVKMLENKAPEMQAHSEEMLSLLQFETRLQDYDDRKESELGGRLKQVQEYQDYNFDKKSQDLEKKLDNVKNDANYLITAATSDLAEKVQKARTDDKKQVTELGAEITSLTNSQREQFVWVQQIFQEFQSQMSKMQNSIVAENDDKLKQMKNQMIDHEEHMKKNNEIMKKDMIASIESLHASQHEQEERLQQKMIDLNKNSEVENNKRKEHVDGSLKYMSDSIASSRRDIEAKLLTENEIMKKDMIASIESLHASQHEQEERLQQKMIDLNKNSEVENNKRKEHVDGSLKYLSDSIASSRRDIEAKLLTENEIMKKDMIASIESLHASQHEQEERLQQKMIDLNKNSEVENNKRKEHVDGSLKYMSDSIASSRRDIEAKLLTEFKANLQNYDARKEAELADRLKQVQEGHDNILQLKFQDMEKKLDNVKSYAEFLNRAANSDNEIMKKDMIASIESLHASQHEQEERLQQKMIDLNKNSEVENNKRKEHVDGSLKYMSDSIASSRRDIEAKLLTEFKANLQNYDARKEAELADRLKQVQEGHDNILQLKFQDMEKKLDNVKSYAEFLNRAANSDNDKVKNELSASIASLNTKHCEQEHKLEQKLIDINKMCEIKDSEMKKYVDDSLIFLGECMASNRAATEATVVSEFETRLQDYDARKEADLADRLLQVQDDQDNNLQKKSQDMEKMFENVKNYGEYLIKAATSDIAEKVRKARKEDKKQAAKLGAKMTSLTNSDREHFVKVQQMFQEFQSQILEMQNSNVAENDDKLIQLKNEMIDREEHMVKNFSKCIDEVNKDATMIKTNFGKLHIHLDSAHKTLIEKLEGRFQAIEISRVSDTDSLKDGLLKMGQQRSEITAELGLLQKHLEEYLHASLVHVIGRVDIIESIQKKHPIGFTARTIGCLITTKSPVMKDFKEVMCNEGGHYDSSSGVFTAPVSGMYFVSLTHTQSDDGEIYLNLIHGRRSDLQVLVKTLAACTWTYGKHSSSSDCALIKMDEGDRVYVQVQHYCGSGRIWSPSSFSCYLIR